MNISRNLLDRLGFSGTLESQSEYLDSCFEYDRDGALEGALDGAIDGALVGAFEGGFEGAFDGALDETRDGALDGGIDGALVGAFDGALDGDLARLEPCCDFALVGALDGACDSGLPSRREWRERCDRRDEAMEASSSNLNRGSRDMRAVVTSIPDMAAALGVMNSPSTEVPMLLASASATPRRHISTWLRHSVLISIISSMFSDSSGAAPLGPSRLLLLLLPWICLMILYPPNMTIVAPRPTPAAMRNCGLASRPNTVGAADLNMDKAAGAILAARLLISARVSATAAMASGFFCRWAIVVVALWCRQSASSSNHCVRFTSPFSSGSSIFCNC